MTPGLVTVVAGDARLSMVMSKELRQLVNISIAAGKFILIHPHYELIREAMRMHLFEVEDLEDFEVHNWQYELGETITYSIDEVLFMYTLLELSCRIFLCDVGDDLRKMALENGETTQDEFVRVRSAHLRQAQFYIHFIKNRFDEFDEFKDLQRKLNNLNTVND